MTEEVGAGEEGFWINSGQGRVDLNCAQEEECVRSRSSAKNKICLGCLERPRSLRFLSLSRVSQVTKN